MKSGNDDRGLDCQRKLFTRKQFDASSISAEATNRRHGDDAVQGLWASYARPTTDTNAVAR